MNENNLKFEVIWKDDDMFEIRISANIKKNDWRRKYSRNDNKLE